MPTMPAARVRAGTAAACGALALIAACSGAPDRAPSASPSSQATGLAGQAGPQPAATTALAAQLAPAQARQAFEAFFPRFDAMVTHHRVARVPRLTVGAEEQVRAFGTRHGTGLPPLAQESERFYVPRVTSYPRWFVEEAATHSHGAAGGDAFVMVQSRRGGPWQEARLIGDGRPGAWQWWELLSSLEQAGPLVVRARATDRAGRTGPRKPTGTVPVTAASASSVRESSSRTCSSEYRCNHGS